MTKRTTAIVILIVAMVFSFMPTIAFAVDATSPYIFTHDTAMKYWHRSPHRVNDNTPPAMYHLITGGESLAAYCCDFDISIVPGTKYKRINLEDAGYYTAEDAKHIRYILANGYWVGKDMAAIETAVGISGLTTAEYLTATQAAIWTFANVDCITDPYVQTAAADGTYAVDTTTVNPGESATADTEARIEAVYNYLCSGTLAPASVVVELGSTIVTPILQDNGLYDVVVEYTLTSPVSAADNLAVSVQLSNNLSQMSNPAENTVATFSGITEEELMVGLAATLTLSGVQYVAEDVYFYEPEGGRRAAQCMVGYGSGETPVFDTAALDVEFTPPPPPPVEPEPEIVEPVPEPEPIIPEPYIPWYPPYVPPVIPEVPVEPEIPEVVSEEPLVIEEPEIPVIEIPVEEEIPLAEVPKTGDNLGSWCAVMLAALFGLIGIKFLVK